MSLYITYIDATTGKEVDVEYHVGTKNRSVVALASVTTNVQADGHELEYIKRNFTGIPLHNSLRVQTWRGPIAQFIVDHL